MKLRHLLILLAILGVLVAGIIFKKMQVPPELTQEEFSELAVQVDSAKVQAVEIGSGTGAPAVRMIKNGEQWRIPARWDLPVSKDKVDAALTMVKGLKGELRGNDEGLLKDFEIADDQAYYVRLFGEADAELVYLLIGKKQVRYSSSFVRQKGSNQVWLVDYNLMQTFGIANDQIDEKIWAELKLIDVNPVDVTGVKIEKKMEDGSLRTLELTKTKDAASGLGRWSFSRLDMPFGVEASKVTSYIDSIKSLTGNTFHDPEASGAYALDPFFMQVTVTTGEAAQSQPHVITVGGTSDTSSETRYLRSTSLKPVVTVSKYAWEQLAQDEARFFPDNPLGVDADKLNSVSVHSPKGDESATAETFKDNQALIDKLKSFAPKRLLLSDAEKRKVKPKADYRIEIVPKEGQAISVDVGESLSDDQSEYAAQIDNGTHPFSISKDTYQKIFGS